MEEIKFSIYKICKVKVADALFIKNIENKSVKFITQSILKNIVDDLNDESGTIFIKEIASQDLLGLCFKTKNEPIWNNLIYSLIDEKTINSESKLDIKELNNTSTSYILMYLVNNEIYVMTGGRSNHLIKKYVLTNYGLNLIPKLLDKNSPSVKRINENNMSGNRLATTFINRRKTSFATEENLNNIYRKCDVEINAQLAKTLGITYRKEEKKKNISIEGTHSISIKKPMNIEQLKSSITKLNLLEKKDDNFPLNYFVEARYGKVKPSELFEKLVENIVDGDHKCVELVGENYELYYFESNIYHII